MSRRAALLAVVAVAGLGTATTLALTGGAAGRAEPQRLVVEYGEGRLALDAERVRAGRLALEERNGGRGAHDLVVLRTDRPAHALPTGLSGVATRGAGRAVLGELGHGAHGHGDRHAHLAASGTRRRSVVLAPGRYVLLCPLPGHYQAGQHASLLVE